MKVITKKKFKVSNTDDRYLLTYEYYTDDGILVGTNTISCDEDDNEYPTEVSDARKKQLEKRVAQLESEKANASKMTFTAKRVLGTYKIYNKDNIEVLNSAESQEKIIERLKGQLFTYHDMYDNPVYVEKDEMNIVKVIYYDVEVIWPEPPEKKEETNKYFSQETLKEALGDSGMAQMEAVTINPGASFLAGEPTNVNCVTEGVDSKDIKTSGELTTELEQKRSAKEQFLSLDLNVKPLDTNLINNVEEGESGETKKQTTLSALKNSASGLQQTGKQAFATATNLTALGLGTYATGKELLSSAPDVIMTLSQAIISKVMEVVTERVTEMAMGYLSKHAQAAMKFPMQIQSYAMAYFNANKLSIGDILKSLNDSSEGRQEKKNEENNKKGLSNFMNKINNKSKKFIDKINKFSDKATSYIGMVTAYIQNGPEWVTNEVDKQIGELVGSAQKEIDKQWAKDKAAYDAKAKLLGDKLGKEMTAKFNNALMKAQKNQLEKMEKIKKKAKSKVVATTAKAASKLGSMLGMYIPIPDMV